MKINKELNEAIEYFKQNDAYKRLLKGIKQKYISLGEIKGNVIINKPSIEEKQALSGLMKKDYYRNTSISINLAKLQQRLSESKFSGVQLYDILNNYFCEEILTKKEEIKNKNDEFEAFWKEILSENEGTYIYDFLLKSIEKKDSFYQTIKRYYKANKGTIKNEFINTSSGINYLKSQARKEKIRIPVFSARITSNPHEFDRKNLCGKLLIQLLCYIDNVKYPKNNEELAELYYNNGLLIDDVSNMILCKNIIGFKNCYETDEGKTIYEEHQGLIGFDNYNEPVYLTLYNLSNISGIKEGKYNKVLITENPAVFMEIMTNSKLNDLPLICTYGQVKLAGIMLMDLLIENNYQLYYSGDLDPEGVQIADKLKQRYKEKFAFIGFDKQTYYRNISEFIISESRLKKLECIKSIELKEVCDEMKKIKKASYEEKNISYIFDFLEKCIYN